MNKGFIEVRVNVTDAEIVKKLDILRLERGISSNSFIIDAITEKLRREGYLKNGVKQHERNLPRKREQKTPFDIEWAIRKHK